MAGRDTKVSFPDNGDDEESVNLISVFYEEEEIAQKEIYFLKKTITMQNIFLNFWEWLGKCRADKCKNLKHINKYIQGVENGIDQ